MAPILTTGKPPGVLGAKFILRAFVRSRLELLKQFRLRTHGRGEEAQFALI